MKTTYKQCLLIKDRQYQVAFIPSKFAVVGKILKIEGDDGWEVFTVGQTVENPPDTNKSIREHRKHTGDSLPKEKK
jgi:hypothetical protein